MMARGDLSPGPPGLILWVQKTPQGRVYKTNFITFCLTGQSVCFCQEKPCGEVRCPPAHLWAVGWTKRRRVEVLVARHQWDAVPVCACACVCARVSAHVRPRPAESAWGGRCCEQSSRRFEVRAPVGGAASCLQCCSPGALQWAGETGRAAFPISPFPSSVVGYVAFHARGHSPLSLEPGPVGGPLSGWQWRL